MEDELPDFAVVFALVLSASLLSSKLPVRFLASSSDSDEILSSKTLF